MTGNGHDTTSGDDERVSESPVPDVPMTRTPEVSVQMPSQLHSPPQDTQPFSQFITPAPYRYEVDDEEGEGVWGYLIPLDHNAKDNSTLVLKRRTACPLPQDRLKPRDGNKRVSKKEYTKQEEEFEKSKTKEVPSGGFLLGRHPECGKSALSVCLGRVTLTRTRSCHQRPDCEQPSLSLIQREQTW